MALMSEEEYKAQLLIHDAHSALQKAYWLLIDTEYFNDERQGEKRQVELTNMIYTVGEMDHIHEINYMDTDQPRRFFKPIDG